MSSGWRQGRRRATGRSVLVNERATRSPHAHSRFGLGAWLALLVAAGLQLLQLALVVLNLRYPPVGYTGSTTPSRCWRLSRLHYARRSIWIS